MDGDGSTHFWAGRDRLLGGLQDVFFSANVACALGYALALYLARSAGAWPPHDDAGYYFLKGVARVSDLLHLGSEDAVSTGAVARGPSISWNRFAIETTFLTSLYSVTALVLLLTRGSRRGWGTGVIFRRISGMVALFGAPVCCLLVLLLTARWTTDFTDASLLFQRWFLFDILAGESVGVLILFVFGRRRAISGWTMGVLLTLHFGFWGLVLYPDVLIYMRGFPAFYFLHLILWLIPSAGTAWLLYVRAGRDSASVQGPDRRFASWTIALAVLGTVTLLVIWVPGRDHPVRAKDMKSAEVEMSRGPCFGSCPAYIVTIHGDGSVEYVGKMFARRDRQTDSVGGEGFARMLQELEQVHFFALDDRAFSWCFDTPSVSVTVSLDGRSKRVVSDAGCTGAPSGVQAAFVRATDDIDKIVGSERWVRCDGRCQ
jgi:hypothetical protein